MTVKRFTSRLLQGARAGLATLVILQMSLAGPFVGNAAADDNEGHHSGKTNTPIKHVIVIVGENRTFDHIFATYQPKAGETVDNLLSKKMINEDGTPGPNFADANLYAAAATDSPLFQLAPKNKTLYSPLPVP